MFWIQNWAYASDTEKILKDLCERLTKRKLFKSFEFRQNITKEKINDILQKVKLIAERKELEPDYYVGIEHSSSTPYEPYKMSSNKTTKAILIKQNNGSIKEISKISNPIKALSQENVIKTYLIYPREIEDEIIKLKGFRELFK